MRLLLPRLIAAAMSATDRHRTFAFLITLRFADKGNILILVLIKIGK